jgi:hypothetical protein
MYAQGRQQCHREEETSVVHATSTLKATTKTKGWPPKHWAGHGTPANVREEHTAVPGKERTHQQRTSVTLQ